MHRGWGEDNAEELTSSQALPSKVPIIRLLRAFHGNTFNFLLLSFALTFFPVLLGTLFSCSTKLLITMGKAPEKIHGGEKEKQRTVQELYYFGQIVYS